jgi:hypothetical protein
MLGRLAVYRVKLLEREFVRRYGTIVQRGPFAGMSFLSKTADSCLMPKLLGCYEAELHSHVRASIGRGYEAVLNIGCAEGYYAVGLARLLPSTQIYAYDTDAGAQAACRRLAEANNVAARVQVHGIFRGDDFESFAGRPSLVLCDIEGAEATLLDPERYPALREFDVIVELHEFLDPGISARITDRFAPSHSIELVQRSCRNESLPDMFDHRSDLLRFLAVWEWRQGKISWAVMRAQKRTAATSSTSDITSLPTSVTAALQRTGQAQPQGQDHERPGWLGRRSGIRRHRRRRGCAPEPFRRGRSSAGPGLSP